MNGIKKLNELYDYIENMEYNNKNIEMIEFADNLQKEIEQKIYELENTIFKLKDNGDGLIKILDILTTDEGILYVIIHYSQCHRGYNIRVITENEFIEYYENEKYYDYTEYFKNIKAKHIYK